MLRIRQSICISSSARCLRREHRLLLFAQGIRYKNTDVFKNRSYRLLALLPKGIDYSLSTTL